MEVQEQMNKEINDPIYRAFGLDISLNEPFQGPSITWTIEGVQL